MDVFTRAVRGWEPSRLLDSSLTKTALQRALRRGRPEIHHSDQGGQYAALNCLDLLAPARVSVADMGAAWQNGYAERLMRTIKEEEVALTEYVDFHDAYQQIGRLLDDVYMRKRIHSSLGYLTPVEFETQWRQEQVMLKIIDQDCPEKCPAFGGHYIHPPGTIPAFARAHS